MIRSKKKKPMHSVLVVKKGKMPAVQKGTKPTKRELPVAEGQYRFWINTGPVVKDLLELKQALGTVSEEVFRHHVNDEKNDFARWIEDVMREIELAKRVMKAKTRKEAIKVIDDHLVKYFTV